MEKQGHIGGLVVSSPVTLVKNVYIYDELVYDHTTLDHTQFSFFMLSFIFQLYNFVTTFRILYTLLS